MNTNELQEHAVASRHLVKRPKALQWFHDGELKKESEGERQAGRFELFLDLLYVALLANFAEDLASHADGKTVVKYVLIFAPAWRIWSDLREIMNSYYTDDLIQRTLILWVMALLVCFGNNATEVGSSLGDLRTTTASFIAARVTIAMIHLICSFASYQHRVQSRIMAALILISCCIWTPLFFRGVSIRAKIAVAAVAISFDEAAWILTYGPWIKRRLHLTYSTAVDIAHEIDRMAAFFIIILGEYLYSIIVGNPARGGLNTALLKAVWTLIIAFCLNWLYVNGDGSLEATHPIRRSATTAFLFFSLHMPLTASLLVGGHVCAASAGLDTLETGERWVLGAGLGIGLFCLWLLAMLFASKDRGKTLIMPKPLRVCMRLVVAVILVLLPLTGAEEFGAVKLLSTVAGLFVFVVLWETVGGLMKGASVYERWDRDGRNGPRIERVSRKKGEKFNVDG